MCGIAGIWLTATEPVSETERGLRAIVTSLAHRGPDDEGVWVDRDARVLLGHRRLAILDLSPLGHQPMADDNNGIAVVFNGEIYNFLEIRRDLEARGFAFRSQSDTEVLLNGYRCWGEHVLARLVGMFAFAIWDRSKDHLFLARDRAGEKPLYYSADPKRFAFASEIAGLAGLAGIDLEIDRDALALYLQYQYVPSPYTIYRGVRKLPPGHALTVRSGRIRTWRYWDPVGIAAGPRLRVAEDEALAELETLLRTAVRGQMLSDVPLGAFLSGGIDSTAIVSAMTEVSSTRVRTFTVGFEEDRYDESRHAAGVARHLGTDHTVEYLTEKDALPLVERIPAMYGEPFADSSALPTHLVSRVARRHVKVCLSGDGGDEAFGGYGRYDELEWIVRLSRATWPLTGAANVVLRRLPGRIGRGGQLLGVPPKDIYRARVGVFRSADVLAMVGSVPALAEYERAWRAGSHRSLRQRAMLADLLTYLPEAILVKVDRAAMNVSLETRAPLLDHRLIEFAVRLPESLVRRKRLLKRLVYRRVPRALVDRPKQGFGIPLGRWFRTELRDFLLAHLAPARMSAVGIDDYRPVQRLLTTHMSGAFDEHPRLWALAVLSLWHDTQQTNLNAAQRLAAAG